MFVKVPTRAFPKIVRNRLLQKSIRIGIKVGAGDKIPVDVDL